MSEKQESPYLRVSKISKSYVSGKSTVRPLQEVSFDLYRGDFAAVVGPSGSGKSTLLHLLAGLDVPDSGSIELKGTDYTNLGVEELASERLTEIGIVFQFFNLLPTLTLEQNISVPGYLSKMGRAQRRERAAYLLHEVGISELAKRYPHEVSGGEIQRAAIARALFNSPSLILADEPTGNLDPETAMKVIELFESIIHQHDIALLVVTHDQQVSDRAHQRLQLESGQLRI